MMRDGRKDTLLLSCSTDHLISCSAGKARREHDVSSNGVLKQSGPGDGIPDSRFLASQVDGFPFLHVGHRYYDPATGRFLQRDPIGIRGGLNVYAYVFMPTFEIDPTGLTSPRHKDVADPKLTGGVERVIVGSAGGALGGAVRGVKGGLLGAAWGATFGWFYTVAKQATLLCVDINAYNHEANDVISETAWKKSAYPNIFPPDPPVPPEKPYSGEGYYPGEGCEFNHLPPAEPCPLLE